VGVGGWAGFTGGVPEVDGEGVAEGVSVGADAALGVEPLAELWRTAYPAPNAAAPSTAITTTVSVSVLQSFIASPVSFSSFQCQ
jgi:hypothetical protein